MSLNHEFSEMVQEQSRSFRFIHPLMSGMEFILSANQKSRWMQELSTVKAMAAEKEWKNLPELLEPLHRPEVAVVITNAREQIEWVSEGFFHMTGYRPEEAAGRKPDFLQGEETDRATVKHIRQNLDAQKPTEGVLVNYRKEGEPYFCKVAITPLFNKENELVNFIAVEEKVPSF